MALQHWAVPQISSLLSLDDESSRQIVAQTEQLSNAEAAQHLEGLLGDSPKALEFISSFNTMRSIPGTTNAAAHLPPNGSTNPFSNGHNEKAQPLAGGNNGSSAAEVPSYAPPSSPPPATSAPRRALADYPADIQAAMQTGDMLRPPRNNNNATNQQYAPPSNPPPGSGSAAAAGNFTPPSHAPPSSQVSEALRRKPHTNAVIEAGQLRAKDEQEMQNLLQTVQMKFGIYNSDIEPEHDTDYYCNCMIHNYQRRKWARIPVQEKWSKAVMYPGEKSYNDDYRMTILFASNPYRYGVLSPYGNNNSSQWFQQSPQPRYHAISVQQTIQLNAKLNKEAERNIDSREPKNSIWEIDEYPLEKMNMGDKKQAYPVEKGRPNQYPDEKAPPPSYPNEKSSSQYPDEKSSSNSNRKSTIGSNSADPAPKKVKKLGGLFKALGVASSEERAAAKEGKVVRKLMDLKTSILSEEEGRWPDEAWRSIVTLYQEKIGMAKKVADLRSRQPLQYLHLLRAGYFEPIPVAWANLASNPLKFSIEASSGWRGITPAWRGFEDTAEERLYWVLNHREGVAGVRLKPDFISAMNMARARMDSAVEPPPEYFSANDTCHTQHTSEDYSRQVMPPPFRAHDRPETSSDDTMILLDVSGSMDFDPVRPVYDQYMITSYVRSTQPKNKAVAKAIVRRFTDAMANHDHNFTGYDLVTFSSQSHYIGSVNHKNLEQMWGRVKLGGGTRVMTGWQKVKDLHFNKHSESATHHPIYGWQAGPETPMLRLLLLLDGEATDMDEFELDLLGLSWAHVTIFLIGVDGCPHHHRHANELQRISDVNEHVTYVDAQGNTPERFVTHELLKRHLGYDVSMSEFQQLEELPAYS